MERLRTWYLEKGIDTNVFASVFARYPTAPLNFAERIKAIQYFQQLPEASALAAANKRVSNILKQTALPPHLNFNHHLLQLEAEQELGSIIERQAKIIEELCQTYQYQEALSLLAKLRQPIDRFFEDVMVMTDDEKLRNNRLILLNNLRQLFLQIADISLLQPIE
jgi:glycyl-tRNA synthetase beta chain